MKKDKFNITGMTCAACQSRVDRTVRKLEGVNDVTVNLLTGSMEVIYDDSILGADAIAASVTDAGYGASLAVAKASGESEANELRQKTKAQVRNLKLRLIWSIIFLAPMMYISMGAMGMYPLPGFLNNIFGGHMNGINLAILELALVIPIMIINRVFFIRGFKSLFKGAPNMDSLIAVGAMSAFIYGLYALGMMIYAKSSMNMPLMEKYSMELYLESAGMILTLITLGKFLEALSKGKTGEAIEKLMDLAPKEATVIRNGSEQRIAIEELQAGDTVVVRPGESIPADGTIIEGNSAFDESAITGESVPVDKGPGDTVISATINMSGFVKFTAEKVGESSTIQTIIRTVEEAAASKAPIAKTADKVAGVFVPVVMLIAAAVFVIWIIATRNFELALSMSITVLVISCPCAMGLATPVAIMVGTGKGAQSGILIRSGEALETAHNADTVVLDKTGTITMGKPQVTDVIVTSGVTENELLQMAAALENGSSHPLAAAIMEYAQEKGIAVPQVTDFQEVHGRGVKAVYKGENVISGNLRFINEEGITEVPADRLDALAAEGKTPILFAKSGRVCGIIAMADVEKPTSAKAIKRFKELGLNVVMLTGDNELTAAAVCKKMGIEDFVAGVLPQDKEKEVARLQGEGHSVIMIGDGINDAPALTRADFGLAIGAGTDIAMESADAVLIKSDLLDAVSAVRLSRATIRNIKQNLFWAFIYNVVCIPIAAGVLYPGLGVRLTPMIGSAAMGLSSVFVVFNALRLKFFKPEESVTETKEISTEKGKDENVMQKIIGIEGMSCQHCVKAVTNALSAIEGVSDVVVDLEAKKATLKVTDAVTDDALKEAVTEEGYEVTGIERHGSRWDSSHSFGMTDPVRNDRHGSE